MRLNGQARRILWLAALVFLAQRLSGTFVQAYLWDQAGTLPALTRFNLAVFLGSGAAFLALGPAVKRGRAAAVTRWGLAFQAGFYFAVLGLGSRSGNWLGVLGLVSGVGVGCFWVAQNLLIQHAAAPEEQGRFWGYHGAIVSAASLVGPLVGGWAITLLPGAVGFRLLFWLSAAFFLAGGVATVGLEGHGTQTPYNLIAGFTERFGRGWRRVLWAHVAFGLRDGIMSFLPALLVYAMTEDALSLGNFVVITSTVALVANWTTGRWLSGRGRPKSAMWAGGLALAAGALVLVARSNYQTLLLYNVLGAAFGPLLVVPLLALAFKAIGRGEERAERIVAREQALVVGRAAGMGLLLAAEDLIGAGPTATLALGLAAVAAVLPAWILRQNLIAEEVEA